MLNIRIDECIPHPEAYMEKPPDANELLQLAGKLIPPRKTS
jgi:hypothetical protein